MEGWIGVAAVNAQYQAALPAPWKYYQLINTVHPDDDGPCCIQPTVANNTISTCWMTNTTMETYTQYFPEGDIGGFPFPKCGTSPSGSMNCTDCHAAGLPMGAPTDEWGFPQPTPENPNGTDYQIFSFLLFHAQKSCGSDVTYDGLTDIGDILEVMDDWACNGSCHADANLDGSVDVTDLLMVMDGWGECD